MRSKNVFLCNKKKDCITAILNAGGRKRCLFAFPWALGTYLTSKLMGRKFTKKIWPFKIQLNMIQKWTLSMNSLRQRFSLCLPRPHQTTGRSDDWRAARIGTSDSNWKSGWRVCNNSVWSFHVQTDSDWSTIANSMFRKSQRLCHKWERMIKCSIFELTQE